MPRCWWVILAEQRLSNHRRAECRGPLLEGTLTGPAASRGSQTVLSKPIFLPVRFHQNIETREQLPRKILSLRSIFRVIPRNSIITYDRTRNINSLSCKFQNSLDSHFSHEGTLTQPFLLFWKYFKENEIVVNDFHFTFFALFHFYYIFYI